MPEIKSMTLKALSLWQPHASAIVDLHKRYETRSWHTWYRGWILIHAAKKWGPTQQAIYRQLTDAGILPSGMWLPVGGIIGIGKLVGVHRTHELAGSLSVKELALGNYEPMRYAWTLNDVRKFPNPVPLAGAQGVFSVEITPKLHEQLKIVKLCD